MKNSCVSVIKENRLLALPELPDTSTQPNPTPPPPPKKKKEKKEMNQLCTLNKFIKSTLDSDVGHNGQLHSCIKSFVCTIYQCICIFYISHSASEAVALM